MDGVFPVHNNVFKVGIQGRSSVADDMKVVKDLETFAPKIDSNTEDWTPMDQYGWIRRAVTGKGLTLSFKGKRQYGDPGNDYIAGLMIGTGQSVESIFEWTLPDGAVLEGNCVIDLKQPAGGDSTNIDNLEFDLLSDGIPTFTPAESALGTLVFVCEAGSVSGTTKVTTVAPVLTGGNSYMYKLNGSLPDAGDDLTAAGWTAYTLTSDIACPIGTTITLAEVSAGNLAVNGGSSIAVVAA